MIARALQQACRDVGEPVPGDVDARYVIGLGLADALKHVAPNLPPGAPAGSRCALPVPITSPAMPPIPLFAGARELLAEMDVAGFLLGVATGKSRAGLDRALAQQGRRPPLRGDPLRRRGVREAASRHAAAADGSGRRQPGRHVDGRRHDARSRALRATPASPHWR